MSTDHDRTLLDAVDALDQHWPMTQPSIRGRCACGTRNSTWTWTSSGRLRTSCRSSTGRGGRVTRMRHSMNISDEDHEAAAYDDQAALKAWASWSGRSEVRDVRRSWEPFRAGWRAGALAAAPVETEQH